MGEDYRTPNRYQRDFGPAIHNPKRANCVSLIPFLLGQS
jgi:hypothetical protein